MSGDRPRAATELSPALILALDGATFDVIHPLVRAGRMPQLAKWIGEGSSAPLRSTLPPVTFPAWSSFMTGLSPGQHGVFDFSQKLPGAYRVRFANARDRTGTSLFERVDRAGGSVLVLGLPATYPPEPVRGLLVSGFDAPVSAGTDARSASDPELYQRVAQRAGPWMRPDLDESDTGGEFHERAVGTLLDRIGRKTGFALEALRQLRAADSAPDLMMVVFSESDTVGHHYWRDHDPNSPRHDPTASLLRRGAVSAVYERLDAACGEIREAFGRDALCVVLSDHGMGGAAARVVHLNRRLQECGLLARTRWGWLSRDGLARRARDRALRILPARAAQSVFRALPSSAARLESVARFGGFDWRRTRAFSEEANTNPGVWINLDGRESRGCVSAANYERVRDEVIDALCSWRLPGEREAPVVARALRREEVYEGPHVDRAPDVVVELALDAGYGLSLVPTPWAEGTDGPSVRSLTGDELAGGRGFGMNGTHRCDGISIATGPGAARALPESGSLVDVAPTLLRVMGVDDRECRPTRVPADAEDGYSPEEERMVERRLRALGYLE